MPLKAPAPTPEPFALIVPEASAGPPGQGEIACPQCGRVLRKSSLRTHEGKGQCLLGQAAKAHRCAGLEAIGSRVWSWFTRLPFPEETVRTLAPRLRQDGLWESEFGWWAPAGLVRIARAVAFSPEAREIWLCELATQPEQLAHVVQMSDAELSRMLDGAETPETRAVHARRRRHQADRERAKARADAFDAAGRIAQRLPPVPGVQLRRLLALQPPERLSVDAYDERTNYLRLTVRVRSARLMFSRLSDPVSVPSNSSLHGLSQLLVQMGFGIARLESEIVDGLETGSITVVWGAPPPTPRGRGR